MFASRIFDFFFLDVYEGIKMNVNLLRWLIRRQLRCFDVFYACILTSEVEKKCSGKMIQEITFSKVLLLT